MTLGVPANPYRYGLGLIFLFLCISCIPILIALSYHTLQLFSTALIRFTYLLPLPNPISSQQPRQGVTEEKGEKRVDLRDLQN